ncbi:MAG TPA: hypothetical protein VG672_24525, partial [Bryobacteraceae bacterium]|nr:hypothetical protein [Bryobacteraceae bacterium]
LEGSGDPGWYKGPPETQADVAPAADLKRDGIEVAALAVRHGPHAPLEICGGPLPDTTSIGRIKLASR